MVGVKRLSQGLNFFQVCWVFVGHDRLIIARYFFIYPAPGYRAFVVFEVASEFFIKFRSYAAGFFSSERHCYIGWEYPEGNAVFVVA